VENGQFESRADNITVIPELIWDRDEKQRTTLKPEYAGKFGKDPIKIPVDEKDMMTAHVENFLSCVRSREKPHLDVETGARAQAVINLAVQSYREGRLLFWDEKNWKASTKAVKA
jgi:Oxidoreductase family, C-terminal alpha/beta domain